MSGFTKLVPEIIQSSIWNESPEVRCVWIAMIAMKDQDGNLRGNNQTIARMANVSLDWADKALDKFQSPDPYSNNPVNEGRRIEAIPGGWHVVSHELYRAKDYREVEAERKKKYRENKAMSGTCPGLVPDSSASVSVSDSVSASKREVKEGEPEDSNQKSKPKVRARNVLLDSLAECDGDPLQMPKSAWAKLAKCLSEIKEVCPDVTPEEIKRRAANYSTHFGSDISLTSTALSKHWARCDKAKEHNESDKYGRQVWNDCAARCRFWSDKWKSCDKRETVEPKSCECCTWFR